MIYHLHFCVFLKPDPASIQIGPQNAGHDEEHGLLRHACAQHGRLHPLLEGQHSQCLCLMDFSLKSNYSSRVSEALEPQMNRI